MLQLTIQAVLVHLVVALIFVGVGLLSKHYPTTISGISTMSREQREELDLPKIGAFVAKWMYAIAGVVMVCLFIPTPRLRGEALWMVPLFMVTVCYAYLLKYRKTRFKKEE